MGYIGGRTKRSVDILLSIILLVLLSPISVIILIIGCVSGGAPLYAQLRIGQGGKEFYVFKFRSMVINADEALNELLQKSESARQEWNKDQKLKNDPRITRWGRILRKTSLDEVPQLVNVLKGEMSLVGPRPIVPSELLRYGRCARYYLKCKPGLTGLWQVSGRNTISYSRRVAMDRVYVRNGSFKTDLGIILRTPLAVFKQAGAF